MVRKIGLRALLTLIVLRTGFSKAVHVITVIIGDNPALSYVAQSPGYDVAFSRAVGLSPSVLQNVTRQTVYKPGAFSCPEAAEIMLFVAVEISSILDEHRLDFNVLISPGCSFEVMTLGDFARVDESLTNAQRFPTVVAFPSSDQVNTIRAIMSLLDRFSWTTISLICVDPNKKVSLAGLYYYTACRLFRTVLGGQKNKYNLNVHYIDPEVKEGDLDAYSSVLRNAATQSRGNNGFCYFQLNDLTISAFEVMTILLQVVRDLSPLEVNVQNGITFRQLFLNRTFNPLSRPVYIGPKAKTAVITLAVSSTALLATLAIFIGMYHCIFGRSGHGADRPWWDLRPDLLHFGELRGGSPILCRTFTFVKQNLSSKVRYSHVLVTVKPHLAGRSSAQFPGKKTETSRSHDWVWRTLGGVVVCWTLNHLYCLLMDIINYRNATAIQFLCSYLGNVNNYVSKFRGYVSAINDEP
ncbi:hypothetical protein BV898_16567 [Hypsibius exemplaris]|uniref:Receptor ligand binding region domain-containing protein n=1 Tax=Hypsibius exemplaris TaxID=2072580 RepID=A0A9X6NDZ4_HYPEX|nr:hypothetical protein BV898_16567 [Hypsibius exemplaris]